MAANKKPKRPKIGLLTRLQNFRKNIHPETEKSILAVIFIGLAAVLILASFESAGPAGRWIFNLLHSLFGIGYYLFPLIFFIMAGAFLSGRSQENQKIAVTFLGGFFFVAAGLGIIDIISNGNGGYIGEWIGALEIPFGFAASLIIAATILIASLLLTLNLPIKLISSVKPPLPPKKESPTIIDALADMVPDVREPGPPKLSPPAPESKPANESPASANGEVGTTTTNRVGENPKAFFVPRKKLAGADSKNYNPPPLSLLKSTSEKPSAGDLRANANIIKRTLESFGIPVEMGEITIGPKVTRYTLKPAEGVKLSRITALNQDLSLALAAHPIRMEAPIPGKSLVGVEVPNKSAAIVRLGSLMAYPEFTNSGPLTFILGRDVSGEPILADIEKMPHLLIAGSTGSGKSVAIHALITSLLYKNSPETLRLILIDPKRVELTIYNGISHLISPVITDGKKALGVFRWAINEMERRYDLLQSAGARDINSYNKSNPDEPLPNLLIIVDELADLMAAYGREVEGAVIRLAQMARATGIHLVLSTQRPSVEVITGLIKANIPARIALQVASQVDSRTILDMSGAEKLLGGGDMLYTAAELSKPKRIQGAYISEEELHVVTKFIQENNSAPLDNNELKKDSSPLSINSDEQSSKNTGLDFENLANQNEEDELYEEAVRVVREAKKASASLLQRRLAVGYARAARLLDIMEERGVVGPGDGAKPREVYIDTTINEADDSINSSTL